MELGKDRIRNCPLCFSDKYTIWYTMDYDHLKEYWNISDDYFKFQDFSRQSQVEIVHCKQCGLYYNRTHWDWAVRDAKIQIETPLDLIKEPDISIGGSAHDNRMVVMILDIVMRCKKMNYFKEADLKILDFSCGGGSALKILSSCGVKKLYGYDIAKGNIKYLINTIPGLKFFTDLEEVKNAGPFDLIISEASFEHYDYPFKILTVLRESLKPEGVLILGCAVASYRNFSKYKRFNLRVGHAERYFHPWHINHFSIQLLAKIIQKAGFKILPITSASLNPAHYINWQDGRSILGTFKYALSLIIRLSFSWIFFYLKWFPNRASKFFYNSYFVCTRENDKECHKETRSIPTNFT